jgi:hypothetical protein
MEEHWKFGELVTKAKRPNPTNESRAKERIERAFHALTSRTTLEEAKSMKGKTYVEARERFRQIADESNPMHALLCLD